MEISISKIEKDLEKSDFNTNGIKGIVPIVIVVFTLIWIISTIIGGMMGFLSAGLCCCLPMYTIMICLTVRSVRVSNAIKNRDFYIACDVVSGKKYVPGDADSYEEFFFFFKNYGKFKLTGRGNFDSVRKGDRYYLVLCGKSKKIRFIYESNTYFISETDFTYNNGIYRTTK